jgi:hypothetical protein
MARLPRLFTPVSALPPSLVAQLPPASDAAELQLRTFARYGSRSEGAAPRHSPDSALVGGPGAAVMLMRGSANVPAWTLPLLDDHDGVAGVATVVGGAERETVWTPLTGSPVSWPVLLGHLRTAVDSALGFVADTGRANASGGATALNSVALPAGRMGADGERNDRRAGDEARTPPRPRLGRPEAVVTARGTLFLQTALQTSVEGTWQVRAVAVSDGAQVKVGRTLADALGALGETVERPGGTAGTPTGLDPALPGRDSARRWYDTMREAMRQGNWSAFGAAFDSLGRSLGRPPQ